MNGLQHCPSALCVIYACLWISFGGSLVAADARASVSFLSQRGSEFEWKIWSAPKKTALTFLVSTAKPSLIFWMPSERRVYFALGTTIYRSRYDMGAASREYVGTLPVRVRGVHALWVDKKTRRLRVATMTPVEDANIISGKTGTRYRLPSGQSIPAAREPAWGLPYIAAALELRNGEWITLARRATKSDAGETPGLAVLDEFRREYGYSNDRLLESYTCASGICRNDVPEMLLADARKLAGTRMDPEELSIAPTASSRPAILFGLTSGDTLHMTGPIFAVSADSRLYRIESRKRQLAIGLRGSMALLAEEWTGDSPQVIELRTGHVLFAATGWEATWIPGGGLHTSQRPKGTQGPTP